jgi:hypothetical protein
MASLAWEVRSGAAFTVSATVLIPRRTEGRARYSCMQGSSTLCRILILRSNPECVIQLFA